MNGKRDHKAAVEFESEGATLRGYLYKAATGEPPFPVVVMAHGTTATITMATDRYAQVFAEAGISALLYDHRNMGISGGEPRQEINPWVQSRGFRDAVTFASSLRDHDPARIALWGDSYAGGEVLLVAACDPRVRAIVAQCPVLGATPPDVDPSQERFAALRAAFEAGDVSGAAADVVGPIPVVSSDQMGTPSLLTPIQAYRWFIEYGGRHGSAWRNTVTRVVPSTVADYSPYLCTPHVRIPTLMMVAPGDEMIHANPTVARAAFALLAGNKEWHGIDGGHFGLLHYPSDVFTEASTVQASFLVKHLLTRGPHQGSGVDGA